MPELLTEDRGPVRVLTLNRPDKLNALDTALTRQLMEALERAGADRSVRAVLLTGAGRAFSSGADTAEFRDLTPQNAELVEIRAGLTLELQSLPRNLPKPVVAAVHGVAMGGGAGLALASDMVVAATDLRFGYPELKHGLVPALVMTSLSRHLGPKRAFEMVATGRILSGDEMAALGLANRSVPADAVLETAAVLAATLADRPRPAMAASKRLLHAVADLPYAEAMEEGRLINVQMRGFAAETAGG